MFVPDRRRLLTRSGALLALLPALPWATARASTDAAPVSVEEAPYVQTPPHLVRRLLQLGDLRAGEMLWDLGSGDGRIVLAAARDFGARGVGYDIDASLVADSRASARRARLAGRAKFFERDVLTLDFSGPAAPDVVTLYLLPELNLALKPKLLGQLRPGARVLSVDWDMGADWPADETLIVPYAAKPHGRERSYRLMLWVVPAKVAGRWRVDLDTGTLLPRHAGTRGGPEQAAHAALDGLELTIEQAQQQLTVQASRGTVRWAQLRGLELDLGWHSGTSGARTWRLQGRVVATDPARADRPAREWRGRAEVLGAWGNSEADIVDGGRPALRLRARRIGE